MRRALVFLCATLVMAMTALEARALINPVFTPVHLVRQSRQIAVLNLAKPDAKGKVVAKVREVLKGKRNEKTIIIDLAAPGDDRKALIEWATMHVARAVDSPALLFVGKFLEEGVDNAAFNRVIPFSPDAFLHIGGKWLGLYRGEGGIWEFEHQYHVMEATWGGGSDMLLHCVKYVLSDPKAEVPVESGVEWDHNTRIATFAGKVTDAAAVDLTGDGRLALFTASASGDRLLIYQDSKKAFKDVTAARGLASRSREAVWGDFNGDGRLDLASWTGKALVLWQQAADGVFSPRQVDLGDAVKKGCLGLAVVDAGVKGRPGLLLSTPGAPVLLVPEEGGAFKAKALTRKPKPVQDLGRPAACIVADVDGDGFSDILQPFEKGSLFYRGRGAGAFAEPAKGGVALGELPAAACVADFDHDGLLDVFVAAEDFSKIYQNLGGGAFAERIHLSGQIRYISNPNARGAQVCDVNNDGRQDVLVRYSIRSPHLFFNRGFRSFGHAHSLDLAERALLAEKDLQDQQAALVADLNGDGAQDMVVVGPEGAVWVFYRSRKRQVVEFVKGDWVRREIAGAPVLRVMLPLGGPYAGPLTVTGWAGKRCLGAWNVVAGSNEAWFARGGPGPIEIRWQFPGGKPQKKTVTLQKQPVRIVLEADR